MSKTTLNGAPLSASFPLDTMDRMENKLSPAGSLGSRYKPITTSDQGESDPDQDELPEEEINTIVGVSIGKEQTRLMSPMTPVAEKFAAMDDRGEWDFYDTGTGNEEDDTTPSSSQSPTPVPIPINSVEPFTEEPHKPALPSPWTASPKLFETPKSPRGGDSPITRSRASTGSTGMLADLNIKRFLSSLGLPALIEQNPFKELSIPRLPLAFGGQKDGMEKGTSRNRRSDSAFLPSFSRSNAQSKRPSRDGSPETRSPGKHLREHRRAETLGNRPEERYAHLRTEYAEHSHYANNCQQTVPYLRRTASDQSLPLSSSLSKISSLGDDSRWENVQGQVNSRMKAIVDSFQDSTIKLPSLPSIKFSALRPDFSLGRSSSDSKGMIHTEDTKAHIPTYGTVGSIKLDEHKSSGSMQSKPNKRLSKAVHHCFDDALDYLTGDVVVLGGYRGSILRSAEPPHRQLWVPVKVGLNIRKVNLEVGLEAEDEENMESSIFSSGMLTHIGPVDISRRLIKRLRSCKNAQEGVLRIHDYGYDWRLSPHLLSHKLTKFLETLICNEAGTTPDRRGATVIAHSLGGLLTRHAVNRHPELFAGVIYAGVPQHCVNILGPLRNGDEVLLSSRVLTAQVNFTIRTSYVLLPESGRCFINKETKEEYPVNFFDGAQWKEYAFSPCIAPALPSTRQPERKGLLSTVSGSLPTLKARRHSGSLTLSKDHNCNDAACDAACTVATKVNDITHPDNRTLNMHMGHPQPSQPNGASTIPLSTALAYLQRTLDATIAFKRELDFNPQHCLTNAYPPVAVLYSTSTPTVYGAYVSSREAIKHADAYENLAFASGDGVVLARAAMVPKGYKVEEGGKVKSERGHVGLLGDLEGVGKCLLAVIRGRERGVGLGAAATAVGPLKNT